MRGTHRERTDREKGKLLVHPSDALREARTQLNPGVPCGWCEPSWQLPPMLYVRGSCSEESEPGMEPRLRDVGCRYSNCLAMCPSWSGLSKMISFSMFLSQWQGLHSFSAFYMVSNSSALVRMQKHSLLEKQFYLKKLISVTVYPAVVVSH